MGSYVNEIIDSVSKSYSWEKEFLQAVREVLSSLDVVVERDPKYRRAAILERIVEPERTILFRVPWQDDRGAFHVNRGYRVEFNSAIGPYKGGLRFHPSVNLGILKFLGFEQIFKNSLTTLPMGGGKGGSDFDPKGKSDDEVMRFCQSFMNELFRHIGADTDVPAGDIGVGGREIGYLFGQYKKPDATRSKGVLTGKGLSWGGSLIRPEATGYGCVYFAEEMLKTRGQSFAGQDGGRVRLRQRGPVHGRRRSSQLGGKVVTLSDSNGSIVDEDGIDEEKWRFVMELKNVRRGRIKEYADKFKKSRYVDGERPWRLARVRHRPALGHPERAGPGGRQDPGGRAAASASSEGANMPTTPEATEYLLSPEGPLRPGQGGQRRRRGLLRPGDVPELHAPGLDARGGGREAAAHHGQHPRRLPEGRPGLRHPGQLRQRGQHRRLQEGGRRNARSGPGLSAMMAGMDVDQLKGLQVKFRQGVEKLELLGACLEQLGRAQGLDLRVLGVDAEEGELGFRFAGTRYYVRARLTDRSVGDPGMSYSVPMGWLDWGRYNASGLREAPEQSNYYEERGMLCDLDKDEFYCSLRSRRGRAAAEGAVAEAGPPGRTHRSPEQRPRPVVRGAANRFQGRGPQVPGPDFFQYWRADSQFLQKYVDKHCKYCKIP